jgi:hypothetical protein
MTCSFDARTRRSTRLSPKEMGKRAWREGEGGLLISCARATRGLRRPSLDARSGRPSRPPPLEALWDDQLEYPGSPELQWWIPVGLCNRLAQTECSVGTAMRKGGLKPAL